MRQGSPVHLPGGAGAAHEVPAYLVHTNHRASLAACPPPTRAVCARSKMHLHFLNGIIGSDDSEEDEDDDEEEDDEDFL